MRSLKRIVLAIVLFSSVNLHAQTMEDGLKAWRNENFNTARDIFKKVTDAEPTNAMALFYYGQSLFKTGDVNGAKAAFDKGTAARPTEFWCMVGQAKCMLDAGDAAGAEKKIMAALKGTKSKDPDIYSFSAEMYTSTKNKDWNKAIDYAQKGLLTPRGKSDFNAFNALGDVYFEKHYSGNGEDRDIGLAVSNYEKSYQLNTKSPYAMTRIGKIWSTTRTDLSYRNCIEALEKAKAADADYLPMHSVYASIYEISGQYDKSKNELGIYMAGSEDKVKSADRMINILYQLKDWKGTLELAQKMNAQFPDNCDYIRVLAHANTELGNNEAALGYFTTYQTKCSGEKMRIEDYTYLAKANRGVGNDSATIRYYNQIIGLDSTKEQAILKEMANGFYSAKKFDRAIEIFNKLMVKYPTPNTQYKLMDAYYLSKKWKDLGIASDSFISGNNGNPLGYLYKARSLYYTDTINDRKAAADMYKVYLGKTTDTAFSKQVLVSEKTEAHQQICFHYIKKKNLKAAIAELDEALIDDPNNKSLIDLRAKIDKAMKPQPAAPTTKPTTTVKPK